MGSGLGAQVSPDVSTAKAHSELDRRYGPVRILIIKDSPSCRLAVTTANGAGEGLEWVEVIEGTIEDLAQYDPAKWDLMITHVHADDSDAALNCIDGKRPAGDTIKDSAEDTAGGPVGIFRKLFRRRKPSEFDLEERRSTGLFLTEIQRDIGIALSAIEMGDFDTLGEIAARLKHDGAIYNFEKISGLGAALFDTVPTRDARTARNIAQKLMDHLGKALGDFAD